MSYILDALKKSERERSVGTIRKLQTPDRVAADASRRTAVVLLLVLVVLIGFLAAMAWIYREPLSMLVSGARPNSPAISADRESRAEAVIDSTRVVESSGVSPVDPASSTTDTNASIPGQGSEVQKEPRGNDHGPKALAELPEAIASRLPPLDISVLSYSQDPARRFVMIDGQIYKENDQLPDGIRVETIERQRVILSMLSERFYIHP